MRKIAPILISILLGGCATSTPLQVAVFDPVQAFDRQHDVNGVRLNLVYGNNENVRGIDLGFGNVVQKQMVGIQAGAIATCSKAEDLYGVQSSVGLFGVNMAKRMKGIQFVAAGIPLAVAAIPTGFNEVEEEMHGIQVTVFGLNMVGGMDSNKTSMAHGVGVQSVVAMGANRVDGDMEGLQLSGYMAANMTEGKMRGVQACAIGFNVARDMSGIQIGAGNLVASKTRDVATLKGLQIGMLNCVGDIDLYGLFSLVGHIVGEDLLPEELFRGEVNGCQIGFANVTKEMNGLQVGYWCNRAREVRGMQVAPFNYCRRLNGVQVGLLNVSLDHKYPFLPIVNARF